MPPTLQEGMSTTVPTTPITMAPYLCHCEALPNSSRNGRRLTTATVTMLWQSLFHYCSSSDSAPDPTSTIQTGLDDVPQGQPRRQPGPKDEAADLHRVGTVTPLHTEDNLQAYTCKSLVSPCGYKRGGRAPFRDHRTQGTSVAHKNNTHFTPLT